MRKIHANCYQFLIDNRVGGSRVNGSHIHFNISIPFTLSSLSHSTNAFRVSPWMYKEEIISFSRVGLIVPNLLDIAKTQEKTKKEIARSKCIQNAEKKHHRQEQGRRATCFLSSWLTDRLHSPGPSHWARPHDWIPANGRRNYTQHFQVWPVKATHTKLLPRHAPQATPLHAPPSPSCSWLPLLLSSVPFAHTTIPALQLSPLYTLSAYRLWGLRIQQPRDGRSSIPWTFLGQGNFL